MLYAPTLQTSVSASAVICSFLTTIATNRKMERKKIVFQDWLYELHNEQISSIILLVPQNAIILESLSFIYRWGSWGVVEKIKNSFKITKLVTVWTWTSNSLNFGPEHTFLSCTLWSLGYISCKSRPSSYLFPCYSEPAKWLAYIMCLVNICFPHHPPPKTGFTLYLQRDEILFKYRK